MSLKYYVLSVNILPFYFQSRLDHLYPFTFLHKCYELHIYILLLFSPEYTFLLKKPLGAELVTWLELLKFCSFFFNLLFLLMPFLFPSCWRGVGALHRLMGNPILWPHWVLTKKSRRISCISRSAASPSGTLWFYTAGPWALLSVRVSFADLLPLSLLVWCQPSGALLPSSEVQTKAETQIRHNLWKLVHQPGFASTNMVFLSMLLFLFI